MSELIKTCGDCGELLHRRAKDDWGFCFKENNQKNNSDSTCKEFNPRASVGRGKPR